MKLFPQLETERFVLRKLTTEDAEDLFQYFSNDEVTKYYDLDRFDSLRQAEELIQNWNIRYLERRGFRWAITVKSEGDRVIGTCGFHNWSQEHYKAEIGYELDPEYWRQGVMSEVLQEILRFGFEDLGLNRIEAFIDPDNIRSRYLLEKIGFHEEGYLKECFFEKNQFVDAVLFALLNKQYLARLEQFHGKLFKTP
ncbi:GNAT family protein [Paenibacillus macerans]|uniref:GNAT family N-acetyltransferase n=1 Tax=Paenibacillus macerans TaxID=44252 RepID=UPI002DBB6F9D|nr:GNAT family protein [Paenibacillus macerans]MEC0330212.1 GNAT family protein [Paenibacillus macerans]MED4953891.1 GNAT family protein [Paenibacillus macerans]